MSHWSFGNETKGLSQGGCLHNVLSIEVVFVRKDVSIIKIMRQVSKKEVYPERSRRIFVGLSGGVDSSVAAALLKKAGHNVTGVFIKVWQPDFYECTWKEDRLDAMRVAAKLEIPFVTLDLEKEYKREVVDYMIREYKRGKTPNPDIMCNKHIKFGAFFEWAIMHGADFVATGHYARAADIRGINADSRGEKLLSTNFKLLTGSDQNKDQSYFLWTLNQKQLSKTLFPVGGMTKPNVRKLAKKFALPTAEKKDSQGLCFIGKVDMKEFLRHYVKEKEGDVRGEDGARIGYHPGSIFFTIGERHGFTITKKTPADKPLYVVGKDVKKNTITVASDIQMRAGNPRRIFLKECNWIRGECPALRKRFGALIRYRATLLPCEIVLCSTRSAVARFRESPVGATPGQSLVLYDKNTCIGGGIIR